MVLVTPWVWQFNWKIDIVESVVLINSKAESLDV